MREIDRYRSSSGHGYREVRNGVGTSNTGRELMDEGRGTIHGG